MYDFCVATYWRQVGLLGGGARILIHSDWNTVYVLVQRPVDVMAFGGMMNVFSFYYSVKYTTQIHQFDFTCIFS